MAYSGGHYEPEEGDEVTLFIHKFASEDFEKAQAIMTKEFGAAFGQFGQTRRGFWVADPEAHEVVGISFVKKGQKVEDWNASERRKEVLRQLESLELEPVVVKQCKVIGDYRVD